MMSHLRTTLIILFTILLAGEIFLITTIVLAPDSDIYIGGQRFYTGTIKERPGLESSRSTTRRSQRSTTGAPVVVEAPPGGLPAGTPITTPTTPTTLTGSSTTPTTSPNPTDPTNDQEPTTTPDPVTTPVTTDPVLPPDPTDPTPPPVPPAPPTNSGLVWVDPTVPSLFTWDPSDVFSSPPVFNSGVMDRLEPAPIPDVDALAPIACPVNESNFYEDIFNDPNCQYFVVAPGDYSEYERVPITRSGTASNPRVIFSTRAEPWDASTSQRARFDSFDVDASYIYIMNLEFYSENNQNPNGGRGFSSGNRQLAGNYNVWHGNYIRNSARGCRCYGNYNTWQFNLTDDRPEVSFDVGGVGFYARAGEESRGNRIIYNEFVGYSDGIGIPRDGSDTGSLPATIIAYNYSWVPTSQYITQVVTDTTTGETQTQVTACAEDGYDIKNGGLSDSSNDTSYFLFNISRGHRVTDQSCGGSGSSGAGWVFHNWAHNWKIAGNLSYDDAHGTFIKKSSSDGVHKVQNIQMYKNVFAHLPSTNPGGLNGERINENDGLALRFVCDDNCSATNNLIFDVNIDSHEPESGLGGTISGNTLAEVVTRNLINQTYLTNPSTISVPIARSPLKNPGSTISVQMTSI